MQRMEIDSQSRPLFISRSIKLTIWTNLTVLHTFSASKNHENGGQFVKLQSRKPAFMDLGKMVNSVHNSSRQTLNSNWANSQFSTLSRKASSSCIPKQHAILIHVNKKEQDFFLPTKRTTNSNHFRASFWV